MEKREVYYSIRETYLCRPIVGDKPGFDFSSFFIHIPCSLTKEECEFGKLYLSGLDIPITVRTLVGEEAVGPSVEYCYAVQLDTNSTTSHVPNSSNHQGCKVTIESVPVEVPDTKDCDQLTLEGRIGDYEHPNIPKEGLLKDLLGLTYRGVSGKKESEGKLDYEFDWEFIEAFAKRMSKNKGKYEPYNWKKPIDIESLKQAMTRHHVEIMKGNYKDEEDELGHVVSVACNSMMLWYQLTHHKK